MAATQTAAPVSTVTSPQAPAGSPRPVGSIGHLLLSCQDRPGVVAAVSGFLAAQQANIIELAQYSTDPEGGRFFQRTVFHLPDLRAKEEELRTGLDSIAADLDLTWTLTRADRRKRVAIMVSKDEPCLVDLLDRTRRGELAMDVAVVISNHPDLADEVRSHGVPFVHVPVTRATKPEAEQRQLDLLQGNVDLVVMARYMQILSGDFLERVGCPVINIHHSFLPAFMGANPYAQARSRGVKLIGATAHYATEDLDEGPIIEQDVTRVSHGESVAQLQRRGADVERAVLGRAVQWHLEDRVFRHGNATVVL